MKARTRFLAITGLTLVLTLAASTVANEPAVKTPNIIFVLIDDMGWTDLGCFGSKFYETPNIDRLCAQGMKFTDAYAACTVCSPTRAAVMTGKYPARLHITDWIAGHERPFARLRIPDWQKHLPLEEKTIAEQLKARGYSTACIGKWHLGDEEFFPEKQGFDFNFGGCAVGAPRSYFPPYGVPAIKDEHPGQMLSDRLTDETLKFIESNKERPFFIYLAHYAVHTPIGGKPEVIEKYKKKDAAGLKQNNPVYAALVESVDDSIGRVMARLAELKLDQNTVIFFTSDNGGLYGTVRNGVWNKGPTDNSPLRWGKGSAYEGGVRVPLIVKWPGVTQAGSVCATPVISVDHFPTMTAMAGADASPAVDGESLVSLLKGNGPLKRDAIYWHYPHYHPGSATPYSAVRAGDWRLIEFFEDNHIELYNLKDDVGEQRDLASKMPEKAAELRKKLQAWRESVGAQLPTVNPNADANKDKAPPPRKGKGGGKRQAKPTAGLDPAVAES